MFCFVNCYAIILLMARVLVGMSGGIDSSVAAYLLKEQGHDVVGITMRVFKDDGKYKPTSDKNSCFSANKEEDIIKTTQICKSLGIEHKILDISDKYEAVVLKNFRDEYLNGRTPNPCVWCNQKIKFGSMVDSARSMGIGFDYFATGHYARILKENGRYALMQAEDKTKDQSYFLYRLSQKQLATTMFPLGKMTKAEVRKIDVQLGFHDENQTESQDFYSGRYTDLLDVKPVEGNIVNLEGKVLGRHDGFWNYTIGQRKGLGIADKMPLYVVALNPEKNEVVVGYEDSVSSFSVTASNIVWGAIDGLDGEIEVKAKIRSTGIPVEGLLSVDSQDRLCFKFNTAVKAATKGQSLVVYKDEKVLCGGIIDSVCREEI